ncbi:MAG: electron transport complex subunit RsxB [Burkholderiaceae bacterium]|nr:electron transport complex subunit RsxB [Burkholderiaceae bacterium]
MSTLAARIEALLPQTQCTRCGYSDCAGYAQAIAACQAGINQCPPGGAQGIARLAALTGQPPRPLDPAFGVEGPRAVAVIDEAWCIGCTLCLDACPVDAIAGLPKRMHTVIEPHCTGCALCIPACPVDCIVMETVTPGRSGWQAWSEAQARAARARYAVHRARCAETAVQPAAIVSNKATGTTSAAAAAAVSAERKRSAIEAALAQARARRGQASGG